MKFKHLLLLSALTATPAFSAPAPISTLPAATTPLGGTEVVPIVQAGVTKKVTIGNVRASGVLNVRTIYGEQRYASSGLGHEITQTVSD